MKRLGIVALLLSLAAAVPAAAQITTCQGDRCTVEEDDGTTRELSPEEVGKIMRGNSRTAIGNIYCQHSADSERCEAILDELFSLFPR